MMLHPGAIFGFVILAIGVPVVAWLNVRAVLDKRGQSDDEPGWITGEERE